VYVDSTSLSGLSQGDATKLLTNQLAPVYFAPVRLVSPVRLPKGSMPIWQPSATTIGYQPDVQATVQAAERVGRTGSFLEQLLDRLPIHPNHSVRLIYRVYPPTKLDLYVRLQIFPALHQPKRNAGLQRRGDDFVLAPSQPGAMLDTPRTEQAILGALGRLSRQTVVLPVDHVPPVITDQDALRVRQRVENFLSHPPVINIGKRVFVTSRSIFAPMLSFREQVQKQGATIVMQVNSDLVRQYASQLAAQIDRAPQNAKLVFSGQTVEVLVKQKNGRTLDQADAFNKLLSVITTLKPTARLRFHVTVTPPPVDQTNPASLGISTWLGTGETSFQGAGPIRLQDIQAIAGRLDNTLLPPNQDISFNFLVSGTPWPDRVYIDQETEKDGQIVPSRYGAMQQVATTFLRALYAAGLPLLERHAHAYRLPWYEPPYGMDAIVSPNGEDLRFRNNTGKYLLLETRVEPLRQELYIYVYGPKLGWQASVDSGKFIRVYPHAPDIIKQDPSLVPGEVKQTAWAHDGADTVVRRVIKYPNGSVTVDHLRSHYQAWQAILLVGVLPTPTPAPHRHAKLVATGTPTPPVPSPSPTPSPAPTPTPTFNH
jgi:vancomycin resistance protein YoaR